VHRTREKNWLVMINVAGGAKEVSQFAFQGARAGVDHC
jgi:hypothetical protein